MTLLTVLVSSPTCQVTKNYLLIDYLLSHLSCGCDKAILGKEELALANCFKQLVTLHPQWTNRVQSAGAHLPSPSVQSRTIAEGISPQTLWMGLPTSINPTIPQREMPRSSSPRRLQILPSYWPTITTTISESRGSLKGQWEGWKGLQLQLRCWILFCIGLTVFPSEKRRQAPWLSFYTFDSGLLQAMTGVDKFPKGTLL